MEITWIADTLHTVYRVHCNMEGEPEFAFKFKISWIPIKFSYEVRSNCEMKVINWSDHG